MRIPDPQSLRSSAVCKSKLKRSAAIYCELTSHLHSTDEGSKAASYLYEMLSNKETAFSSEPTVSAFCKAFRTNKSAWEWLEEPEQNERRVRLGVGMEGVAKTGPQGLAVKGASLSNLQLESNFTNILSRQRSL